MSSIADTLAQARQLFLSGKLAEAETQCRLALQSDPANVEALGQMGLVAVQTGRGELAVDCFHRAAELDPKAGGAWYNLGGALRSLGRLEEAAQALGRAAALEPGRAEVRFNLANALADLGRSDEAAAEYREALRLRPGYVKAHNNLGNLLRRQGRLDEAAACFRDSVRLEPGYALGHHNLATVLVEQGNYQGAEAAFREALRLQPDLAPPLTGLGRLLKGQGRLDEAVPILRRAVEIQPDDADTRLVLGEALHFSGRLDDAAACFRAAVETWPELPAGHYHLAVVLHARGELQAAEAAYREALRLKPDYVSALNNLGVTVQTQGRLAEGLASIEEALRIAPDFPIAHLNRALAWLRRGDFSQGWLELEWRRRCPWHELPPPDSSRWDGNPLPGGTILLRAEQGLGDTIQFIRYAPIVRQRVGRVVVECQPALVPLLSRSPGIDQLIARGDQVPPHDVQAPLLSVPGILGTTSGTIPADVPYVHADGDLVETWRERLAAYDGLKVGIHWQGSRKYQADDFRSIPLANFQAIARVPRVRLVSLQKGEAAGQLAGALEPFHVLDFGADLDEASGPFMDTAAILQCLDLVITSDSAVAHVAGAVGAPVWLAAGFCPDWRWRDDGDDCPWYPTMRVFRQQRFGDWDELFARIADDLARVTDGRHDLLGPQSPARLPPVPAPTSYGELLDRISILEIKCERFPDGLAAANLRRELAELVELRDRTLPRTAALDEPVRRLDSLNRRLWQLEDDIRGCGQRQDFGPQFVAIASSIYETNDRRAEVKREIDLRFGCALVGHKSYSWGGHAGRNDGNQDE